MTASSSHEVALHLARAREDVQVAEELFRDGHLRGAVSRAYYAMYHAAHALLRSRGLTAKSHKGLLSVVSEQFVQTGELDRGHFAALRVAKELREESDYDVGAVVEEAEARRVLEDAGAFLHVVEALLA